MRVGDVQCAVPCKGAEGLRLPTRCSPPTSVGARARAGLKGRHQAVHRAIPNAGGGRACVRPRRDRPARPATARVCTPTTPQADYTAEDVPQLKGMPLEQVRDALAGWRQKARPRARPGRAVLHLLAQLSALPLRGALRAQAPAPVSQGAPQSVVPARQARCIPDWLQPWHGGGRLNTLPPLSCSPHSSGLPSCWADNHGLRWSACNAAAWG